MEKIDYFIGGIGRNLDRGDMLSALHNLTQTITDLVHGLYAVNLRHCPYEKWAVHYLNKLPRKPENLEKKIAHILVVPSMTKNAIKDRMKTLQELTNWLKEEINESRRHIPKEEI